MCSWEKREFKLPTLQFWNWMDPHLILVASKEEKLMNWSGAVHKGYRHFGGKVHFLLSCTLWRFCVSAGICFFFVFFFNGLYGMVNHHGSPPFGRIFLEHVSSILSKSESKCVFFETEHVWKLECEQWRIKGFEVGCLGHSGEELYRAIENYCWCKKSYAGWYGSYSIFYKVLYTSQVVISRISSINSSVGSFRMMREWPRDIWEIWKASRIRLVIWLENDGFLLSSDKFAVPPDPFVCPKKGIWPYNPILGMGFRLYSRDGSGVLGCGYLRYIYLEPIVFPSKEGL